MASYLQNLRLLNGGEKKRCYYLYGPDRVLVENTVDKIRVTLGVADGEYASLAMSQDQPRDLWAELNQYPMNPLDKRLVLVRDVERVKNWDNYLEWLDSRHIPQVTAILVDSRQDLVTSEHPHLAATAKTARLVKCGPTSDADTAEICSTLLPMTPDVSARIVDRTADIREALDVTAKLRLLGTQATTSLVDALTESTRGTDFIEALLSLDKKAACLALVDIGPDEVSVIVGGLDYRLHTLGIMNKYLRRNQSVREIVTSSGIPPFLIKRMLTYAKHYDRGRINACTTLLVLADNQLQSGEREGILETLVALW